MGAFHRVAQESSSFHPAPGPWHLPRLVAEGRRDSPGRGLRVRFPNLEILLNTGSDEGGWGWSLGICISNELLRGANAAGPGPPALPYERHHSCPRPIGLNSPTPPIVECRGHGEMKFSCLHRSWRNQDQ